VLCSSVKHAIMAGYGLWEGLLRRCDYRPVQVSAANIVVLRSHTTIVHANGRVVAAPQEILSPTDIQ
jgi:hypothetical protein